MTEREDENGVREIVVNGGSHFVARWLPAIIAVVSGAGSAYAMLQVQQVQIESLQDNMKVHLDTGHPMLYSRTLQAELYAHTALPGHAGITQRLDGIFQQLQDHQRVDNEVNGVTIRRIEKLEDRLLDMERTFRKGRAIFQLSKDGEKRP